MFGRGKKTSTKNNRMVQIAVLCQGHPSQTLAPTLLGQTPPAPCQAPSVSLTMTANDGAWLLLAVPTWAAKGDIGTHLAGKNLFCFCFYFLSPSHPHGFPGWAWPKNAKLALEGSIWDSRHNWCHQGHSNESLLRWPPGSSFQTSTSSSTMAEKL